MVALETALRVGCAIYNDGYYHAAHDAWEAPWLELETGTEDERLLHGLIQFTAAMYHATERNWDGAVGLSTSGLEYLNELPAEYRVVDLEPVRDYMNIMSSDPEIIERRSPPTLRYNATKLQLADLNLDESLFAAKILADELGYDEAIIESAISYIETDRETGNNRLIALIIDFVSDPNNRETIFSRLSDHVNRRNRRASDVDGLF